jgi:hypothetical protein
MAIVASGVSRNIIGRFLSRLLGRMLPRRRRVQKGPDRGRRRLRSDRDRPKYRFLKPNAGGRVVTGIIDADITKMTADSLEWRPPFGMRDAPRLDTFVMPVPGIVEGWCRPARASSITGPGALLIIRPNPE